MLPWLIEKLREQRTAFRSELSALQQKLISYTHILAEIAAVEDITDLESP